MTTTYSVHVEVGAYSWDVTGNDIDNDVAATYGLADPLVIAQRWPDSDLAPNVQPNPMEATLSVIAPDSTTYAFALGDPVAVEFYSQGGFTGNGQTFYGRVATLTSAPHDLGVIYTLGCIDYTVDLQETEPVGRSNYAAETLFARVDRIMDAIRLPHLSPQPPTGSTTTNLLKLRAASPQSPYDMLYQLLGEWNVNVAADEFGNAATVGKHPTRPILIQNISGRRLAAVPYGLSWDKNGRRIAYAPPARLATVAGKLSITVAAANSSPTTLAPIIDAGNVEFDTTFTQVKGPASVSRVVVVDGDNTAYGGGDSGTLFGDIDWPNNPPTTRVVANYSAPDWPNVPGEAASLQLTLAPDQATGRPDPKPPWSVGDLTWLVWNEPVNWRMPGLGDLLTVARVLASKSPVAREWLAGVVSGWTLTVAKGRPVVTLSLLSASLNVAQRNRDQLGATLGVASWDSPALSTVTFAGLSTRDTFDDYRLVRGS